MKKIQRWSLIIGIIMVLSVVYPVSAFASYYSSNLFTSSQVRFEGTGGPVTFSDPQGTQHVIVWSKYIPFKPIQDSSSVALFAVNINYTKIPPFAVYAPINHSTNAPLAYIGTLTQYNVTIDLTLKSGINIVKEFSVTITLNNKTKDLSVTKIFSWHPPAPSLVDLFNPSSQKTYSLHEHIIFASHMINASHPDGVSIEDGNPNIYLKWFDFNAVFTIYGMIVVLLTLVVTGLYTGIEYRKYAKIKSQNVSFFTYLKNKDFNFPKKKKD